MEVYEKTMQNRNFSLEPIFNILLQNPLIILGIVKVVCGKKEITIISAIWEISAKASDWGYGRLKTVENVALKFNTK